MFDKKTFNALCTPAKIYFGIAIISSVFALLNGVAFGVIGIKIFFALFWTFILGWLCKNGLSNVSWFLVLLPYVVILLTMLRIANITEHRGIFRSLGIQGAYGQEALTMPKKKDAPTMPPMPKMPKDMK
jgi:hypothetical protein